MKTLRFAMLIGGALAASATVSQAQGRMGGSTAPGRMGGGTMGPTTTASSRSVPAGLCQVWIEGLPANRQPAPTDCETARRQAPANSRIIYGAGSTTGGVYYPNGKYDPRYDPRSPQYDPRYGQRGGQHGGQAYPGERGRGNRDWKAEKEREKYEQKQQKEREKLDRKQQKEWKKGNKGHDDGDTDDDRGGYASRDGRGSTNASRPVIGAINTTATRTCVDANRDGICDIMQTARGATRP